MIKNIVFDLGGVIITLGQDEAIRRFEALGLADAHERLDAYTQSGIFGDLERGDIDAETFRVELGRLVGHEVTYDQCRHAWLGYCRELPQRHAVSPNIEHKQRMMEHEIEDFYLVVS